MFFSQAVVIQYDYFHYRLQMQYGNAQVIHYGSIFISQVASSIVRSMAVSICGFQEKKHLGMIHRLSAPTLTAIFMFCLSWNQFSASIH